MNWNEIKTIKKADVVVIGGGPAGIAAAVSAARNGASTVLIEKSGCLGGMMTIGAVMPLSARSDLNQQHFGGILEEFLQETITVTKELCSPTTEREHRIYSSPHVMKYVALDMALKSGVDIIFHSMLAGVVCENNRIQKIILCTKSGLTGIEGRLFIDATGDGDLLAFAGEEFVLGSEPGVLRSLSETGLNQVHNDGGEYSDYQESGQMQPVTMMFTMANINYEAALPYINKRLTYADLGTTREEFLKLPYANTPGFTVKEDSEEIPLPQGRVLFFETFREGEAVINMTRVTGINGADALDLSKGEAIAQRQMFYVADFLKRFIPGFDKAYLLETGDVLGVRETRRLVGQYVLTGKEAIRCVLFDDVIAHGSYIIDIHDPQGQRRAIGGQIEGSCYDIPYRCLLPKTIKNLLVAGRCISTDHVAHSSTRIQGTCMLTGQAAGTAAAMALRQDDDPSGVEIRSLQKKLVEEKVRLQPDRELKVPRGGSGRISARDH